MNVQELINKLSDTQPLVNKLAVQIQVHYAANLLGWVRNRVQQTGINARSVPFKSYSTRPALLGYSDYPLNKRAYARLKSQMKKINKAEGGGYGGWVTINGHRLMVVPGGYKAIRNAAGYQIMHKDFTVTNAMWRSVKVLPIQVSGTKLSFGYGSVIPSEAQKINGHNKREGINILEPTAQELEKVQVAIVEFCEEEINKMLNGR